MNYITTTTNKMIPALETTEADISLKVISVSNLTRIFLNFGFSQDTKWIELSKKNMDKCMAIFTDAMHQYQETN